MKNCWYSLKTKEIWVVCVDCQREKRPYWVQLDLTLQELLNKIKEETKCVVHCAQRHEIEIARPPWFTGKRMDEVGSVNFS